MQEESVYIDARELSGEPDNSMAVLAAGLVLLVMVIGLISRFMNRPR